MPEISTDICEEIAQVIPERLIQHQMRTPCHLKDWSLFLHLNDSNLFLYKIPIRQSQVRLILVSLLVPGI